ncbi:MAG: family 43 glycosylhydrolase, partial [Armatimonadetes bacterium]|nr:family 43 glycosylhydrolase [Armatimonadota bacterium]
MARAANTRQPVVVYPELPAVRDKTLVAWVHITDLAQRGGSVLTIERRGQFDAIVFGEIRPGVWMAGSDGFQRTQREQDKYPRETAGPNELIRLAAVYRGNEITLWRNDEIYARHTVDAPAAFGSGSTVLIGLRHEAKRGQPQSYFAGVVEEARLYGKALSDEELCSLRPGVASLTKPLGWWTFEDGTPRDLTGNFPDGELHSGAYIRNGKLYLDGKEAFMMTPHGISYWSPVHFRPEKGVFADPIPFFWDGQYHVFYLQGDVGPVPWQHIVSRNLIHWEELPPALVTDGPPDSPNGMHMFTGSGIEKDGTFHIFYTGHNPDNPAGLEFVLHATSPDLVHWTKHPEEIIGPDGHIYAATPHNRNWRDPYVFWNDEEGQYWMVVIADDAKTGQTVQGLLVSRDLKDWKYQPPLEGCEGQECPDLFKIGDTWYLIGGHMYYSAKSSRGPYRKHENHVIDRPGLYAGKRMFDGRRHVWVAWAWDNREPTDACPDGTWGGYMCLPRELYPGPDGQLYCKP